VPRDLQGEPLERVLRGQQEDDGDRDRRGAHDLPGADERTDQVGAEDRDLARRAVRLLQQAVVVLDGQQSREREEAGGERDDRRPPEQRHGMAEEADDGDRPHAADERRIPSDAVLTLEADHDRERQGRGQVQDGRGRVDRRGGVQRTSRRERPAKLAGHRGRAQTSAGACAAPPFAADGCAGSPLPRALAWKPGREVEAGTRVRVCTGSDDPVCLAAFRLVHKSAGPALTFY
jgi:hypothetical protein